MLPNAPLHRQRQANRVSQTPFPYQQLSVLALCRICEPIAFMSIFPYIYFMISSFHITSSEHQISLYAGLVTSAFAFAEFSTGILWGRLSDRIGRKPVLMAGLIGTLLSMLVFGFATSLPMALLGRALGGALNGNIGVLQTTVAEIVTEKEHQPSAYAIMPFVWSFGSILGPLIGGTLAEPCKNYPELFARGTLFDRYPFLLPNLVCAGVLVIGILVGILFLEETHQEKKHKRDIGLEIGQKLLPFFDRQQPARSFDKINDANYEESRSLFEDEPPPGYRTTEGSPRYPSSRSLSPAAPPYTRSAGRITLQREGAWMGTQKAFTKPVVIHIIGYGILAYHTMSFDQLLPIFLSSKVSTAKPELPLRFSGGFAMSSKDEGILMLLQGFYSMFAQAILFPVLARRFGCLNIFKTAVIMWPMLYLLVPYTVLLPKPYNLLGICLCLLWRTTAQALTYPPNNIMLTNSAPSTLVLGVINGVAGSTASLCRAFGPTITGFIHSQGLNAGVSGLSWWVTGLVCILGAAESLFMEEPQVDGSIADIMDEEAIDDHTMINALSIDAAIAAVTREEHHIAGAFSKIPKDELLPGNENETDLMKTARSGVKRARTDDSLASTSPSSTSTPAASSSFRNVSACNRCRLRKNRCDQNLPACSSCEKAGVKCVGFDPVTKRETPRTYVYYLENRVHYLETLLQGNGIPFAPSQDFDLGAKPAPESPSDPPGTSSVGAVATDGAGKESRASEQDEERKLNRLVSSIGMVSGSPKPAPSANRTSVRDSFFGLQSKPTIEPAPFPDPDLGLQLVTLYFEHANPQIPILHKGEFMALFRRAYASRARRRSPRELYMLNIVFAIGAGIILEDSSSPRPPASRYTEPTSQEAGPSDRSKYDQSTKQHQPEEYHASAMMHLESFLGSVPVAAEPDRFGDGLEELQAVLLLAGFALLRPVTPGLWYISGVATRLAVDLGLHHEDGTDLDGSAALKQRQAEASSKGLRSELSESVPRGVDAKEKGRREWIRDLRRRLWWCVYSFDRLVSTCVGRPFGITDQVITTDFPTLLNDEDITQSGFTVSSEDFGGPSYKRVSRHYFRLRLLQSEILQVLQYQQAQQVHRSSSHDSNPYMHTKLSSSFLQPFGSFHAWRQDMDRRLHQWKESAPRQEDTTVQFSVEFLELNYWQAIIMLYRQGLGGLSSQAGPISPYDEIGSPLSIDSPEEAEDEYIYLKVAEAGQRVLMLYRQLHRIHLVNYTYLATVHLFMAGTVTHVQGTSAADVPRYCVPLRSLALACGP
ncbi:MAG: hypothetical protein Q9170_000334 [Blastenia crenularia]